MYGVVLTLAIFIAGYLAEHIAKDNKLKLATHIWELILWAVVFGVIGARAYHVFDFWDYYIFKPVEILNFRGGGIGIYGGILGGVIGVLLGSYFYKTSYKKLLDIAAIVTPLAQGVGRWGNYFNNELYGKPYNGLFRVYIPESSREPLVKSYEYFHPLFLYESILNLLVFFGLFFLYKKSKLRIGSLYFVFLYLLSYGIIRFVLEPLRISVWEVAGFSVASVLSLLLVLLSLAFFIINYIKRLRCKYQK